MKKFKLTRSASLLWALAASITFAWTASAQEFGYHDPIGPEDWCSLGTNYVACCGGSGEQSPIDIVLSAVRFDKRLPRLRLNQARVTTLGVTNNGHTVQATVPAGAGTLQVGDTLYNLLQFHFHTPSEHAVEGEHAPIEMHMVHKTADGSKTAVLGVFILRGKKNKELEKIWSDLPGEEGEGIAVSGFRLPKIVPSKHTSFRYAGSLTTPPCTEGVSWILLTTPITMSRAQIEKFQDVFSGDEFPNGNARPTQPLRGRIVSTDAKAGHGRGDDDHHDDDDDRGHGKGDDDD